MGQLMLYFRLVFPFPFFLLFPLSIFLDFFFQMQLSCPKWGPESQRLQTTSLVYESDRIISSYLCTFQKLLAKYYPFDLLLAAICNGRYCYKAQAHNQNDVF
jgi:hypothetical protein